jgi:hypothetical protein
MPTTKTKKRKRTISIRVDEDTYKALRRISYRTGLKMIAVLREQFVPGVPVRKGA